MRMGNLLIALQSVSIEREKGKFIPIYNKPKQAKQIYAKSP